MVGYQVIILVDFIGSIVGDISLECFFYLFRCPFQKVSRLKYWPTTTRNLARKRAVIVIHQLAFCMLPIGISNTTIGPFPVAVQQPPRGIGKLVLNQDYPYSRAGAGLSMSFVKTSRAISESFSMSQVPDGS